MIYYITSEVVVKLSISKDSFLVMESTEVRAAKGETATEDGGVDYIKENIAPNSAEKYEPSSARAEENYLHAHKGSVVVSPAVPGDVYDDLILEILH